MTTFDGIVLAGGGARRLGGIDKPASLVAGRSMLQRAVDACAGAERVVVVGPRPPQDTRPVFLTRERPVGSGPAAALAAGLLQVKSPLVVLLAADLPRVDAATVAELVQALDSAPPAVEAVVPLDADGREQPMAAAYRAAALRDAVAASGDLTGMSLRVLVAGLSRVSPQRPALWGRLVDVDTPADLDRARLSAFSEMLATDLGLALDPAEVEDLVLAVARDVAHGVARPAAPVSTFLLGLAAGARGGTLADVRAVQEQVAPTLARYQQP